MSSISVTNHNAKGTFGCPFCVGWGTVASRLAPRGRDPSRRRPVVILERSEESRGGLLEDDTMGDEDDIGRQSEESRENRFVTQTNHSLPQRGRWMRRKEQTDEESCGRSVYRAQKW